MARADPMTIASGAQAQNKDRESNILVALGDRIVQSFVNAYAARTDALSWRTFASWHAATGRSERRALPIGNPIAPGLRPRAMDGGQCRLGIPRNWDWRAVVRNLLG